MCADDDVHNHYYFEMRFWHILPLVSPRPKYGKSPKNVPPSLRNFGREEDLKNDVFWGEKTHNRDKCNNLEKKKSNSLWTTSNP